MADEELQIEIEPDLPEADGSQDVELSAKDEQKPKVESGAEPKADEDEAVVSLREQLAAKTQEGDADRQRLEREASQARADAARERAKAADAEYQAVANAITAVTAEIAEAKRGYKDAMEAADFDKAADFQEKIASLAPDRRALDRAKEALEERHKNPPQVSNDPVQALFQRAAQVGQPLSSRAQSWLRAHPECVTDPNKNAKLTQAHHAALGDGFPAESEEYYQAIEQRLGYSKPKSAATNGAATDDHEEDADAEADPAPKPKPRKVIAAAPVSRDSGLSNGSNNGSSMRVKLTAREAAAATDGTHTWNYDDKNGKFKKGEPIGIQEFAKRKKALTDQGAYDKIFTHQ